MKKLFEFTINKETEVEKPISSQDESGNKVITIHKVKEIVPQKFFIRRPNRSMYDEAELFYGVELAKGVKSGLLTRAMLSKRYLEDSGHLTESEKKEYEKLRSDFLEKERIYQLLSIKDKDRSPEENEKFKTIQDELLGIQNKLQEHNLAQESLFAQTAESRAKNKAILWWILNLSYTEQDKLVCSGATYEERIASYDDIAESNDDLVKSALKRFTFFITLWHNGRAESEEDFKFLENLYLKRDASEKPV